MRRLPTAFSSFREPDWPRTVISFPPFPLISAASTEVYIASTKSPSICFTLIFPLWFFTLKNPATFSTVTVE